MKKTLRNIQIGALSGLAILTACSGTKGLSSQERKQLTEERDRIQEMLRVRESAKIYGSPEIMDNYQAETMRLQSQLDTINAKLGEEESPDKRARRAELKEKLSSLRAELSRREGACVYGPPEMIKEYGRETNRIRSEVEKTEKELKELDK